MYRFAFALLATTMLCAPVTAALLTYEIDAGDLTSANGIWAPYQGQALSAVVSYDSAADVGSGADPDVDISVSLGNESITTVGSSLPFWSGANYDFVNGGDQWVLRFWAASEDEGLIVSEGLLAGLGYPVESILIELYFTAYPGSDPKGPIGFIPDIGEFDSGRILLDQYTFGGDISQGSVVSYSLIGSQGSQAVGIGSPLSLMVLILLVAYRSPIVSSKC